MRDYGQKVWHEKAYSYVLDGVAKIILATLNNNSWINDVGPKVVIIRADDSPIVFLVNDQDMADKTKDALMKYSGFGHVEIVEAHRSPDHDNRQPYGNGYGRKGGNGANTGNKASVYRSVLPDGREVKVRSYDVTATMAFISMYHSVKPDYACGIKETGWKECGVRDVPSGWSNLPIIAHRIK